MNGRKCRGLACSESSRRHFLSHLGGLAALSTSFASFANPDSTTTALTESVIEADDPALRALDELVSMHNIEAMGFGFDSTIISELGYAKEESNNNYIAPEIAEFETVDAKKSNDDERSIIEALA